MGASPVTPSSKLSNREWIAILNRERDLRPTSKSKPSAVREWWTAVADVLNAQALDQPRSAELITILRNFAKYIAVGQIPGPIKGAVTRGRSGVGPTEERHIRIAVTYHAAVMSGLLDDKWPTKIIKDAFGLKTTQPVQKWLRQFKPLPIKKRLKEKMLEAGHAYRLANRRTEEAILGKYSGEGR
jgi:hypothetical protein